MLLLLSTLCDEPEAYRDCKFKILLSIFHISSIEVEILGLSDHPLVGYHAYKYEKSSKHSDQA